MNKTRLFLNLLLLLWDFFVVFLSFLLAYWLRVRLGFEPGTYIIPFTTYLKIVLPSAAFVVMVLSFFGLYKDGQSRLSADLFARILGGISVSVALGMVSLFLLRDTFFSRLVILYVWGLSAAFLFIGRALFYGLVVLLARRGIGQERTLLLGGDPRLLSEIADYFHRNPGAGVRVVGFVPTGEILSSISLPLLGERSFLSRIFQEHQIEQVVLLDELPTREVLELLWATRAAKVRFRYLPSLLSLPSAGHEVMEAAGYPVVELLATRLFGWGRIAKRLFDFVASLLLLILLSPLFLVLAVLIRIDSAGPVFYKSKRVGLRGLFDMCKFRTMHTHLSVGEGYGGEKAEKFLEELKKRNEGSGPLFKIRDDPRITKIGRWLRRTSLDELPQLLNVLKGEMSLVGPRPPFPEEVERYERDQFRRLLVKPGMTGLWQVSGRSDLSFEEYMRLDIHYVEHWSFWLDLWILLKTIGVILGGKGGY